MQSPRLDFATHRPSSAGPAPGERIVRFLRKVSGRSQSNLYFALAFLPGPQREALRAIQKSSRHLLLLINDILDSPSWTRAS